MEELHWLARAVRKAGLPHAERLEIPADGTAEQAWETAARRLDCEEAELVAAVAAHFRTEVADLATADPIARTLLPLNVARRHQVFPLAVEYSVLRVATSDPLDADAEQEIGFTSGRHAAFRIAPPWAIASAIRSSYPHVARAAKAQTRRGGDGRSAGRRADASAGAVGRAGPVLVVDDDAENRTLARAVLARDGFEVVEAEDGAVALDLLRERSFDLAVVDLFMPGLDGRELLRRIRSAPGTRDLPVVILTASRAAEDEPQLLRDGADDYIRKPLNPPIFNARVAAVLRRAVR